MPKVRPYERSDFAGRADWGATKNRMVSRYDRPINWARRHVPTRESHAWHHEKTRRMEH